MADQLGLFLLQYGIQAEFYQSEYGQYWQDAMFGTPELDGFHPDVIYIHTNWRNIINFPTTATPQAEIDAMLNAEYSRFEQMWQALEAKFHCPVIQNNFDRPNYRLMGNRDIWDPHGRSNYLSRLNQRFYAYAAAHEDFYINDIDYLSADYGLTAWGMRSSGICTSTPCAWMQFRLWQTAWQTSSNPCMAATKSPGAGPG